MIYLNEYLRHQTRLIITLADYVKNRLRLYNVEQGQF